MARLELLSDEANEQLIVLVTLSRRNLLSLLDKLDRPNSARTIVNNDCWFDGQPSEVATLLLRCQDDLEHYSCRPDPPGEMVPETERFIAERGGWTKTGKGQG